MCRAVVLVADVPVGTDIAGALGVEHPVDVDAEPPVRPAARDGHVMPHVVGHARRPADRVPEAAGAHAEGNPASGERHPEVAVLAAPVDIAIEEDVAHDPAVVGVAGDIVGRVLAGDGPHPPLQGEVGGPDVSGPGRTVDLDLDAVDVARAVAEDPEGCGGRAIGEQEDEQADQEEEDRRPSGSVARVPAADAGWRRRSGAHSLPRRRTTLAGAATVGPHAADARARAWVAKRQEWSTVLAGLGHRFGRWTPRPGRLMSMAAESNAALMPRAPPRRSYARRGEAKWLHPGRRREARSWGTPIPGLRARAKYTES